jgi:RNA polymerase sigma factor (sigma-70 family)
MNDTVLIVDDDEMVALGLQSLLGMEDIDAEIALDAEAAEDLIIEHFFPIILADLRLRSADDGLKLIEKIRRISPRSRVAAMTGYPSPDIARRVGDAGAEALLAKPFESDELLTIIRRLLEAVPQPADDATVYAATTPRLRGLVARRFGLSSEDCDDLLQESWCLLLGKRDDVREVGPWLAGTISNLARQTIYRRVRDRGGDTAPSPEGTYECDQALSISVRNALGRLDDRSRQLCELIAMEGLSYAEVGERLTMPVGSVGPLYMRAKERMRIQLSN